MKTFIKIFNGKDGAQVEEKVNELATEKGLEIVNATSFIWQGVIFTTAVFAEKDELISKIKPLVDYCAPKPRTRAKKESEQ